MDGAISGIRRRIDIYPGQGDFDTDTDILDAGDLLIVAPISEFRSGFSVHVDGEISVHSENLP